MNLFVILNWATTWQNQQSDCAPSEESNQPGNPPSLIRVFAVRMKKPWVLSYPLSGQRRLLIRLGGYPGWSESSLGAHSLCWFCHVVAQLCINDMNSSSPASTARELVTGSCRLPQFLSRNRSDVFCSIHTRRRTSELNKSNLTDS